MALGLVQVSESIFLGYPFTAPTSTPLVITSQAGGAPWVSTAGNMLVVWASLDVASSNATTAPVPSFSVADSANNIWIPVGLTSSSFEPARCAVWICPNARVTNWISITANGYSSSVMVEAAEFSGAPAFPVVDFVSTPTPVTGTTIVTSATATQSDNVFGMLATSDASVGITSPSGLNSIGPVSVGSGALNQLQSKWVWGSVSSGVLPSTDTTWTLSGTQPMSAVLIGVSQANFAPVQANPNFPAVKVEMAFGATASDPSKSIMYNQWTDISARAIGAGGAVVASAVYGRTYELSQPEAGTLTLGLRNDDGAFNPLNTSSPYYPNVALGTPIRITALWQGRYYPLYFGYVSKWPQDWPDLPQYGFSKLQAIDIAGVASSINLPSALQGEILADASAFCFPFSEQYTKSTQALNGTLGFAVGSTLVPAESDGFLAVNTSRTSQRTATYQDGEKDDTSLAPVLTGQSLSLLGDAGTGMGASGYNGSATKFRGPGVIYASDPAVSISSQGSGFSVEFILNYATPQTFPDPGGGFPVHVFNAVGPPIISAHTQGPVIPTINVSIQWQSATTANMIVGGAVLNGAPSTAIFNYTPYLNVAAHIVILMSNAGFTVYINGVSITSSVFTPLTDPIQGWCFGPADWAANFGPVSSNYAMSYGSVYPYQLSPARIIQHSTAALTGFQNDTALIRFGRIGAWSGINLNQASWPDSNPYDVTLGAAYDTAGRSVSDALNTLALGEGSLWYATPNGNLMWANRQALTNLAPSIVFGDSNTPGTEVPYEINMGLDYDNTYLYNVTQATQVNGPSTLISPIEKNTTSVHQYFQRGTLSQSVSSTNGQDAYDRAYWSLNKYDQPAMRLRQITVNAAANPSVFTKCFTTGIASVATVNRRPLGAAPYSLPVQIEQVAFDIGPSVFSFHYIGSPYNPENAVLTADTSDVLGNNVLAW